MLDLVVRLGPTRRIARAIVARPLAMLAAAEFDGPFYVDQIRSRQRRRSAAKDPMLHYALVGWREYRAPTSRFDPVYYRSRHKDYKGSPYLHFLAQDDRSSRAQNEIDGLARPPSGTSPYGSVLIFHHARGGGSTKFLAIYEDALQAEGLEPIRLRKVVHSERLVVLDRGDAHEVHDVSDGLPRLLAALSTMSIRRILVSHVVDFEPDRIFDVITDLASSLACPVDVILHDYFCVCPRINLVDAQLRSCLPIPEADVCRRCIASGGSDIGSIDPATWRRSFSTFLMRAERVMTPSDDMRQRLATHLPRSLEVWRPERQAVPRVRQPRLRVDDDLRVVVVGGLNVAKGSHVLAGLGTAIQARRAPVRIDLIGESPDEALLKKCGIAVHGRYLDDDLGRLLAALAPDVGFLPAIWPETWSFVLTQLLLRSLPTFAFDLGAQAERLRALDLGDLLIAPELIGSPEAILDIFLRYRERCLLP